MNAEDVHRLIIDGRLDILTPDDVSQIDNNLVLKGKLAFPVFCDCSTARDSDLEIFDEDKNLLGILCLLSSLPSINVRALSDWQLVAYLTEITVEEFDQPIRLQHDYIVVLQSEAARYKTHYAEAAALWGGFTHVGTSASPRIARKQTNIIAKPDIGLPTSHHKKLLERAVASAHPYERFLRHYHHLELIFDWVVVRRIQSLDGDISAIGRLISGYQSSDLPRLKDLVMEFCLDGQALHSSLNDVQSFLTIAQIVFQDYGKKGNPLSADGRWTQFIGHLSSGYCDQDAKRRNLCNSPQAYRKLLAEVAGYWIFRVRCCVAHHRIGEYLLTDSEEEFMVKFAEPLLLEVLSQVLTNPEMHKLAATTDDGQIE